MYSQPATMSYNVPPQINMTQAPMKAPMSEQKVEKNSSFSLSQLSKIS